MARSFDDLATEVEVTWDERTRRVYTAAAATFTAEFAERVRFGARIAEVRRSKGLSQAALSVQTGVQQAEISRIERGLGNPTTATLLRLAEGLEQKLAFVPAVG